MGAPTLTLAALVLIAGIALWWRHRRRIQALPVSAHSVLCPSHEERARVLVSTDATAQSCRRYREVTACSLLGNRAAIVSERITYLADPDFSLTPLRIVPTVSEPAKGVACRQDCVFVLNQTAVFNARPPLEPTSGASDAVELERQASGKQSISRVLAYYGS
jgi:hypothetical protein